MILSEDDVGRRIRVKRDEERVLQEGTVMMQIQMLNGCKKIFV